MLQYSENLYPVDVVPGKQKEVIAMDYKAEIVRIVSKIQNQLDLMHIYEIVSDVYQMEGGKRE